MSTGGLPRDLRPGGRPFYVFGSSHEKPEHIPRHLSYRLGAPVVTEAHFRQAQKGVRNAQPETVVVVTVVRIVIVTNRTADVPIVIVERAAPQHARFLGMPFAAGLTTWERLSSSIHPVISPIPRPCRKHAGIDQL